MGISLESTCNIGCDPLRSTPVTVPVNCVETVTGWLDASCAVIWIV
jgi:hypothetical protein